MCKEPALLEYDKDAPEKKQLFRPELPGMGTSWN